MFTHHTPATLDARPNLLKLSESAFFQEVLQCFANVVFREGHISPTSWLRGGHALERKPSNAWARKMPALNNPKNAVTVSIIAYVLRAPIGTKRHGTAHSQKDSEPESKIGPD